MARSAIRRRNLSSVAGILQRLSYDPAVQIAGIHGSVSQANPGCSFLDPPTNTVISANRAYNLVGPGGLVLPMYTAFPAIVNLCPAMTSDTGLLSNTLNGLARTIIESDAVSTHQTLGAATTLTDGATYTMRCIVSTNAAALAAGRLIHVTVTRTGQRAGFIFTPTTGSATATTVGGGTVSGLAVSAVGSSRYLVTLQVSNAAWGGTITPSFSMRLADNTQSYDGDAASGFTVDGFTIVASTLTPLGIAEGATRAEDVNAWTLADALTNTEDFIVLSAQVYASGDMGITSQTWMGGNAPSAAPAMFRNAVTTFTAFDNDGTNRSATSNAHVVPNAGVTILRRLRRTPAGIYAGEGRSLGAMVAGSGADWAASTVISVDGTLGTNRNSYSLQACIRRKGGFSQAQIDALYYAFANGRTVPVVA
jgi:hypothetical protein